VIHCKGEGPPVWASAEVDNGRKRVAKRGGRLPWEKLIKSRNPEKEKGLKSEYTFRLFSLEGIFVGGETKEVVGPEANVHESWERGQAERRLSCSC